MLCCYNNQPIANKGVGEQAFVVAAPRLWNALPSEIRSAATLGAFQDRSQNTHA